MQNSIDLRTNHLNRKSVVEFYIRIRYEIKNI